MRILICAHEYYPKGSGIARVVFNLEKVLNSDNSVEVLSPMNIDLKFYDKMIERFGGIGIFLFWVKAFSFIQKNKDKFDLIWLHNPLFISEIEKPVICTVHTTFNEYYKSLRGAGFLKSIYGKLMSIIERLFYKKIGKDYIFTITSKKTVEELNYLGVHKNFVEISNGVDVEKFKPSNKSVLRRSLNLPDGTLFIFVGRLDEQKQPLTMIKCVEELISRGKDIKLVIIGDGPLRSDCESYCRGRSEFLFLGKIPYDSIQKYYASCDFLIMPSVYEGQPLALLEALSCGLIPILSDIPIFEDSVKKCGGGIALSFNNLNAACNRIESFLNKVDEKSESLKIRDFCVKKLSWKVIAEQYMGLLK